MDKAWLARAVTNGQRDRDSGTLPPGFVRAVLDDASYTDSLMDALEARLVALEEVAAGRGVRRLILLWRLGRTLRSSIRPYTGRSFAQRRCEAVTVEWLASRPWRPDHHDR
jgi:hypothetical protein